MKHFNRQTRFSPNCQRPVLAPHQRTISARFASHAVLEIGRSEKPRIDRRRGVCRRTDDRAAVFREALLPRPVPGKKTEKDYVLLRERLRNTTQIGIARVVTLVERKSGLLRIRRVANGEAASTLHAILHALHPVRARVHTLTWDNGSEFAEHALIDIALEAKSYFADPYSSWQRGSNENTNGLLRQYLPKRCDLSTFSDAQLQQIEDKLNQRPRKRLGYRTPQRVFDASFKRVALRS